ncbi:MAG: DUF3500 domain-containing protein, partial [Bacteroidota bacterium]
NKLIVILLSFLCCRVLPSNSQQVSEVSYTARMEKFLSSFDAGQSSLFHFPFDDTLREKWERLPGVRSGLKLSKLTELQKIAFHELMRSCLSTQGYLTVTAVMFNEDIQQKFESNLGRNEFWVEAFGDPGADNFWGWKLEGHHLSVNFTFKGNTIISNTPLLMASNPSNSITDSARAGLIILYKEEELARTLLHSLTEEQLKKAYTSQKKYDIVFSEQDKDHIKIPDDGIYYSELNKAQQLLVKKLAAEYFNTFNPGENITADQFCDKNLKFFYMDSKEKGKPHYYRLINGHQVIEYENYDNHIHCFWRTDNDFGKQVVPAHHP